MSTQRDPHETSLDKELLSDEALARKARFCKDQCSICKRARTRGGLARWFVKYIDRPLCPYCKAYEQVYGCLAYEEPAARGR
jgi:hypothetical protein